MRSTPALETKIRAKVREAGSAPQVEGRRATREKVREDGSEARRGTGKATKAKARAPDT